MTDDRRLEEYRGHKLLGAAHKGEFVGRAWRGEALLKELKAKGVDDAIVQLRQFVDDSLRTRARANGPDLSKDRVVRAFQGILNQLNPGYRAMLKAHARAPDHTLTAEEIAQAAGYKGYSGANLHYGYVGRILYEEDPVDLPVGNDGNPVYTFYLATEISEKPTRWRMRPEVAAAIQYLGLDN